MIDVFSYSGCVVHIINLVVQDMLKQIGEIRDKFRQMLCDIYNSSNNRYNKYVKSCNNANVIWLWSNLNVSHQWNLTCNMFECGLQQNNTLKMFHENLAHCYRVTHIHRVVWCLSNNSPSFFF